MRLFETVGQDVEKRWRATNYDSKKFPRIAADALHRANLPRRVGPLEVLEYVLDDTPLAPQFDPDSKFGDPPITLFSNARFIIDVLFWNDGTTAIHEHSFSGAFQVLAGSSVHSAYRFRPRRTVSSTLVFGTLASHKIELLTRGDVRPIIGGGDFIHALFHLDRPSASIVIRTRKDADLRAQLSYWAPGIGHASFAENERTNRRIEALGELRLISDARYFAYLNANAHVFDLEFVFLALQFHYRAGDRAHMRPMVTALRRREGTAIDRILEAVEEERRKLWIHSLRKSARHRELRYFLAVMLNAPHRTAVLRLMRARFPRRDPRREVTARMAELAKLPSPNTVASEALQIPFGAHTPRVIELVLRDYTLSRLIATLEREFDGVREQRAELAKLYGAFKKHPLLAAWWR